MSKRRSSDRFSYLRQLVSELTNVSATESAKEEVLANLANFAYDPQNYEHFKELNIIHLFLDYLDNPNENLVEYAIGGLCNIALEKSVKETLLQRGAVAKVEQCLLSQRDETIISAITTLMFLVTPRSKHDITRASIINSMLQFSFSSNTRIQNLANLFLQDYCTAQQIQLAQNNSQQNS